MSRTDRTRVCLACRTRVWRRGGGACATCGGELLDLRDEAAQREVAAVLAAAQPASARALAWLEDRRWCLYLGPLLAAVHPRGLVAAWVIGGPLGVWLDPGRHGGFVGALRAVGAFLAGGAMWIVALLALALVGAIVNALVGVTLVPLVRGTARRAQRRTRAVLTGSGEPEVEDDDGEVAEVRGVVRAFAVVAAPLSGRLCVAWTIEGEGPGGEVADGGGGRFAVVADDGMYEVRLGEGDGDGAGDVELDDGDPCELGRGSVALSGWSPGRVETPVVVIEAVLADGDPVEVVGQRELGDGQVRGTFRERDGGAALRIRRVPPG